MNRTMKRMALPIGAALILGSSGFAYMATSTVDTSYAAQGTGIVEGYHVYDVHYPDEGLAALGTSAPGDSQNGVTLVSFRTNPDNATFAAVTLYDRNNNLLGGGGATHCDQAPGGLWTCEVGTLSGNNPIPVTEIEFVDIETVDASSNF